MLRNKEVRLMLAFYCIISAIGIAISFFINTVSFFLVAGLLAVLGITFFAFMKARYRNIAKISRQIDLVLHHEDGFDLDAMEEGELSILHSEITKMTLKIREQNDTLKKDRQYLADSLADIAHQLRTPLTSANLIISLLSQNQNEKERQNFMRELEELLIRMNWLITSLLKLSRLDAGVDEFQSLPVSVTKMIKTALVPLTIHLELRNVSIKIDIPEDATITADFGWLCEAIQNIIKNCMESIGENGNIEIICSQNNIYTQIVIHDSGKGFDTADLTHVFDRFYRGKSANATGYGIGLALSKLLITKQGGNIIAKNHPQGGAEFKIRFY